MLVNMFTLILNMSITASIAAAVTICIRLILHKKLPKAFSYALWAFVLARLLLPFSFASMFSLFNVLPAPAAATMIQSSRGIGAIEYIPQDIGTRQVPEINTGSEAIDNAVNHSLPAATPDASANPTQIIMFAAALVWILGAVSLLAISAITYFHTASKLKTAVLYKDNDSMVSGMSRKLKLKRKIPVFTSDRINTPVVYGFIKPRIILPLSLVRSGNETALQHIVTHELVHIKRLDYIIKPLSALALCVHWFNPVIWLSFILSQKDMEMSCDERVMSVFDSDIRSGYAASLINLAAKQNALLNGGLLAFGESNIKSRIKGIMRYKKPGFWAAAVAAAVLAVLGMLLLTNQVESNPEDAVKDKAYTANDFNADNAENPESAYKIIGEETPAVRAIVDFYSDKKDPVVVYEQMPFEEGVLVLAERLTDGEHYPDLHFIDSRGKVTHLTQGSYCWTLNYTQFKGYTIFFGLAGVEKRATAKNPIPVEKTVKKVEAVFADEAVSAIPAENIVAHVNPEENDTRMFKSPQGYILPVKGSRMPDDFTAAVEGGDILSLSQISIERSKDDMPDYLKVKRADIYNSFAFVFSPMLTPVEWKQGYMEGEIRLEGKTDENGNLNALSLRPAGHMKHTDSFILPQDIRSFYLSYNDIWSTRFSAGETVEVVYPEQRKLLDCRILALTAQAVGKEIGQDRLALISMNEKGQLMLPKKNGYYLFVLRTEYKDEIQTYEGIFRNN